MSLKVDIVIVGAGSAGCTLANRLSEDPNRKVILIEAGPDYNTLESTPADIINGFSLSTSHDWGFLAQKNEGLAEFPIPRPKVVGGSSATNAAFALRGLASDYDHWQLLGNQGWSFNEILPIFKRIETDQDFKNEFHGSDGPFPIMRFKKEELTPVQAAFISAAIEEGHSYVPDHNATLSAGVGSIPMNLKNGIRMSAALTHLLQARTRPNLSIIPNSLVHRILFDQKRACGVQLSNGPLYADRVILSAGAYASPTLLMRSGVGPAEMLQAAGISVLIDLPGVGASLFDHPLCSIHFATPRPLNKIPVPQFQTLLTLRTVMANQDTAFDAQIFPTSAFSCGVLRSTTGGLFNISASVMRPRSVGNLTVTDGEISSSPRIQFNYLTDPYDIKVMMEALVTARHLAKSTSLLPLALRELSPGPNVQTTTALEAYLKASVNTYHHACGTCRMGPDTDLMAVVNPCLEVRGISGLSIVDASVLPAIPSNNIHLTVLMVAEKGATFLRSP